MKVSKGPPPSRFKYDWAPIVEAAEASPGEWVTPDTEFPHSTVTLLQRGRHSLFPAEDYEIATSGNRYDIDGKRWCMLHVRYTPTGKSN